jgi:hypothetical protein
VYVTVGKTVTDCFSIARKLQIVKIMEMKFEVLACVRIMITVFFDGMVLSSLVHGCQHYLMTSS